MPASLDLETRRVILNIFVAAGTVLAGACAYAYRLIREEKERRNKRCQNSDATIDGGKGGRNKGVALPTNAVTGPGPVQRLSVQCLASFGLMLILSTVLTSAILLAGKHEKRRRIEEGGGGDDIFTTASVQATSSINFCEWDFQDHPSIAEPANTASSVASYVPLALLGLFGPPSTNVWGSRQSRQGQQPYCRRRLVVAYSTLFAIGIGSTLLHAMLTATTQGGDELPMLWFVASTGFIVADIILVAMQKKQSAKTEASSTSPTPFLTLLRTALPWLFMTSSIVATGVYVLGRESFLAFYIMFITYAWVSLVGLLWVCLGLNWDDDECNYHDYGNSTTSTIIHDDTSFKADVLLPVAMWTAMSAMAAISFWVAEMIYCADAHAHALSMGRVGAWFYNRGAHACWHCSSGLLAWLLIQSLVAAKGTQDGWGSAHIRWWLVPYVAFDQHPQRQQEQNNVKQS